MSIIKGEAGIFTVNQNSSPLPGLRTRTATPSNTFPPPTFSSLITSPGGKSRICFRSSRVLHHRYAHAIAPATMMSANNTAENINAKPAIATVTDHGRQLSQGTGRSCRRIQYIFHLHFVSPHGMVKKMSGVAPRPTHLASGSDQPLPNCIAPPLQSTLTVSLAANLPSRISLASGFSICAWIARFSGRAPYTGSKPGLGDLGQRGVGDLQLHVHLGQPLLQILRAGSARWT